ncbi:hypothetical protein [Paracandidimonas lactea]|uniref:hypothetical protein n=1 Tax=Paracandidimonas lactea TaxID=2895524 RepID=UPI001F216B30|nr:hypothetical protein [Paracandidimonas lactea]
MNTETHPFYVATYSGRDCYEVAAEDRIRRVKHFDRAQCLAALALPDLQKTVVRAIERRLRQLERGLA